MPKYIVLKMEWMELLIGGLLITENADYRKLFGDNADPSYSTINKLKVLEACILESLRLNPPQPTVRCVAKTGIISILAGYILL